MESPTQSPDSLPTPAMEEFTTTVVPTSKNVSEGLTCLRTGTPIQNITFTSKAFGDESSFKYNLPYTSYGTLRKLRLMQSNMVRVMWDETQKDGTIVRFFGFIRNVSETHRNEFRMRFRTQNAPETMKMYLFPLKTAQNSAKC